MPVLNRSFAYSKRKVCFAPYSVEKVALSGGLVIFFQSLRVARNFDSTRQRTRFHLINGG